MSKAEKITIPHDLVTEQIIIAAAMVDEGSRNYLMPRVGRDDFVEERHGVIWDSITELVRRKRGIDLQAIHSKVSSRVDVVYLKGLFENYPKAPVSLKSHVDELRWGKVRADVIRGSLSDLMEELKDPNTPRQRIKALAKSVYSALSGTDRSFISDSVVLAALQADEIKRRREVSVYPYGIENLDKYPNGEHRMIKGAAPGHITLITGVSGSGKSALSTIIAFEQAVRMRKVLYGAWEESEGDVIEKLALMSLRWSRYKASIGDITDEQVDNLKERMEEIGNYVKFFKPPFSHDPKKKFTNNMSLDMLYQNIVDSGAEVVILDLWERGIPDGSPESERRALFRQQQIAQETSTHCILVCQQKLKEIEMRSDKRPTRDTILGSSAWVDIADTIIGVHRPALFKAVPDDSVELIIMKQRCARAPMTVSFEWDGDRCFVGNGTDVEYVHPDRSDSKMSRFTKGGKR